MKQIVDNATIKRLTWGLVLLILALVVASAVQRKSTATVADLSVAVAPLPGNHFLIEAEDVPKILETHFPEPVTAMPVSSIDIARLEKVLEADPFVNDAETWLDAQNVLRISLTQREPLVRVIDNNGLNYYLDRFGNKMPLSRHYTARVPVITGNLPPYEEGFLKDPDPNNLLRDAFELVSLIKADEFLNALVEQVYVNNRGELTLSPKLGKQLILFGRFTDAPDKLNRLKIFYREGLPYKGWDAYRSFDLRYDGQVVCQKR